MIARELWCDPLRAAPRQARRFGPEAAGARCGTAPCCVAWRGAAGELNGDVDRAPAYPSTNFAPARA